MMQLQAKDMRTARAGYTLFEVIIVFVVIGGLMAVMIPAINAYLKRSRENTAKMELRQIQQGIILFKSDTSKYPAKLRDLVKRPADPLIKSKWSSAGYMGGKTEEPEDPWGERYQYKLTQGGKQPYELYSFGPDGRGAPKDEWIRAEE